MVQEIAAAAEEQSASVEEVTSSVEDVSAISEQSAAGTAGNISRRRRAGSYNGPACECSPGNGKIVK